MSFLYLVYKLDKKNNKKLNFKYKNVNISLLQKAMKNSKIIKYFINFYKVFFLIENLQKNYILKKYLYFLKKNYGQKNIN